MSYCSYQNNGWAGYRTDTIDRQPICGRLSSQYARHEHCLTGVSPDHVHKQHIARQLQNLNGLAHQLT